MEEDDTMTWKESWDNIKKSNWQIYLVLIGFGIMFMASFMIVGEVKCSYVLCKETDGDWKVEFQNKTVVYTCDEKVIGWYYNERQGEFCGYEFKVNLTELND